LGHRGEHPQELKEKRRLRLAFDGKESGDVIAMVTFFSHHE